MTQATAIYGLVVPFRSYLEERGVAPEPIFEQAGLPLDGGLEPEERVSLDAVALAFDAAAVAADDPSLGIDYARAFPVGASGMIGHLLLSAATVREMLRLGVRFAELAFAPVATVFEEDYGETVYGFDFLRPGEVPFVQFGGFVLALMVYRVRRAAGENWLPSRATFAHRQPDSDVLEKYRELFGNDIEFDAQRYTFTIAREVLELANPVVLPGLQKTILKVAEQELAETRDPVYIASRVSRALVDVLRNERPAQLDVVAKAMAMTPRTLQWRLRSEGTTFEEILGELRERLATELLRDSELPISMIANRLGFSEPSAFTRWSRRRFSMTPSDMREFLRKASE